MIKVLQVIGSMNYGGIENVIMNYYRKIDRNDIQFDFISDEHEGRFDKEAESLGAKVYHLPSKSRHPLRYMRMLHKIIKDNKYDIVHSNSNSASAYVDLLPAMFAKCKKRIAHSHNSSCLVKWQHYLFKPLLPTVCTDRLACSEDAAKWLFGNNKNYKIINNGIDLEKFDYNESVRNRIREEYGYQNSFVIGNVGSFQERKNQRFLIEMMPEILKSIDNAQLVLIGDGGTKAELVELCKTLNIGEHVSFLGNKQNVNEFLQAFDVFCFPSLFEGLSVAYVEACCSGLPVIISDRIPHVDGISTLSVLPLSYDKWTKQIIESRSFKRHSIISELKGNELFDIDVLAKQLADYYHTILNK